MFKNFIYVKFYLNKIKFYLNKFNFMYFIYVKF